MKSGIEASPLIYNYLGAGFRNLDRVGDSILLGWLGVRLQKAR
jgi:hypothetical protein